MALNVLRLFLGLSIIFLTTSSLAQKIENDSLSVSVGTGANISSNDFLPFYLVHNQWGMVNENSNIFTTIKLNYEYLVKSDWLLKVGLRSRNSILATYYFQTTYESIDFILGAEPKIIGGLDTDLKINHFGLSSNALPLPMIKFRLNKFVPVAKTRNYIWIKGELSHGYFENNRYMSNARLHHKNLYLKFKLEKLIGFNLTTGFVHFAQYKGSKPFGLQKANKPNAFWDVFMIREQNYEFDSQTIEENGNGNHLGMTEIIIDRHFNEHHLSLNYQVPFENREDIKLINIKDFLVSLNWKLPQKNEFLKELQIEYSQIKFQNGAGLQQPTKNYPTVYNNSKFGGRNDYYNHWLYRSGFTYHNKVLGNPLMSTYQWTQNFMPSYQTYGFPVINNRINSIHAAVSGNLSKKIAYSLFLTSTLNFGTYTGLFEGLDNWEGTIDDPFFNYPFKGGKWQHYSYLSVEIKDINNFPILITTKLAFDFGDLYTNSGLELCLSYIVKTP